MKKTTKIKSLVAAVAVACCGFVGLLSTPTYADVDCQALGFPVDYKPVGGTCMKEGENGNLWNVIQTVINVILGIVGVIAVIMIIIGGIQYSTSSGDSGKVKKAKDTILYGIIGLVIALLAFAIVNFILTNVFNGSGGDSSKVDLTSSYPDSLTCTGTQGGYTLTWNASESKCWGTK